PSGTALPWMAATGLARGSRGGATTEPKQEHVNGSGPPHKQRSDGRPCRQVYIGGRGKSPGEPREPWKTAVPAIATAGRTWRGSSRGDSGPDRAHGHGGKHDC